MKIFIDIGHPAHVHYFKNLIRRLENKGHQFVITARDKEVTHFLLEKEGFNYMSRGSGEDGLFGKVIYTVRADWTLYKIAKEENPDLFLSFASPYSAHAAWLMKKPCITIDDTETASIGQALYKPFTDIIITPKSFQKKFGEKQIHFSSFMELSYLHPSHFKPDGSIYNELGIYDGEPFVLMRFVSWKANHDFGHSGITLENRIKAANEFAQHTKVFISSEKKLPIELEQFKIKISPERIHHVIAHSSLLFGESGTMSSEAAMLGTPAIFVNNAIDKLGTLKEQDEKYGLVFRFTESEEDQQKAIKKGLELLNTDNKLWINRRERLLKENIDPIFFFENIIENHFKKNNKA